MVIIVEPRMNLGRVLSLAALVVALVPVTAASPVQAGKTVTFSCSILVLHLSGTFYVFTDITSTGGYLPSPEQDYLQSFHAGVLFNSQAPTSNIPNKSTTFRFSLAVSDIGPGSYSWISTPLAVKGHKFTQLAQCIAFYNL
jgi:hypothetical protein